MVGVAELPVPVGSVISGRYRVDGVIGSGAMGVVAAAYNLELEQAVAIKFLSAALTTKEALARFRREVRAAARIKSEHVARVLDVGTLESGAPFMVMERLEGNDLGQELDRRGPLPVDEAALYVLQAIEAIAEAHAASVVHRDLKPANLFLARRADDSPLVKVLDFGISKTLDDDASSNDVGLTRTGMIVGSPLYMAPEQLGSSRVIDVRADIWALGGILFQLVTGRTPYDAASAAEFYATLLRDPPTPPSHYRADLPAGFEAVVLRCLERDPLRRFQNVSALADALVPFAQEHGAVHAERARGVLYASRPSTRPLPSLPPVSHFSSAPPVVSGTQRASRRPWASASGVGTAATWGREFVPPHRRHRQWVALAALAWAVIAYVGVELWLKQGEATRARSGVIHDASVAAATLEPRLEPVTQIGSEAVTAPIPAAPVVAPSGSALVLPAASGSAAFAAAPSEKKVVPHVSPPKHATAMAPAAPNALPDFGPRK
jgi:serine/threonine-protein kinase